MQKYRRSNYLIVTLEELEPIGGSSAPSSWVVTSIVSGQHLLVSGEELERLRQVPAMDWVGEDRLVHLGFTLENLLKLADLAILLTETDSGIFLEREQTLVDSHWPPCAAAFHLLNQEQESRVSPAGRILDISALEQESEERALRFLARHGPPPPAFYVHPQAGEPAALPLQSENSSLAATLRRRRTCRYFEPEATLGIKEFSSLMRLTLGPVATRSMADQVELLLKTSPSGGSLHPIEAFPLLFRCEGKESGLYHYRCDLHALELVRGVAEDEARRLAIHLTQGQGYAGECSALVFLVARFDRNFWKYRERENSYAVVLQDAGHLSQTFQMVATDLGLGAFYSAAINGEAIVRLLSLKYPAEAPIGVLGVGFERSSNLPTVPIREFTPRPQGGE